MTGALLVDTRYSEVKKSMGPEMIANSLASVVEADIDGFIMKGIFDERRWVVSGVSCPGGQDFLINLWFSGKAWIRGVTEWGLD
jgi:hypothetical protein